MFQSTASLSLSAAMLIQGVSGNIKIYGEIYGYVQPPIMFSYSILNIKKALLILKLELAMQKNNNLCLKTGFGLKIGLKIVFSRS